MGKVYILADIYRKHNIKLTVAVTFKKIRENE